MASGRPTPALPRTIPGQTWPQSGLRYLGSFLIEYSMWFWVVALLLLIVARLRAAGSRPRDPFMLETRLGQVVRHPEIAFSDLRRGPGAGPRLGSVLAAALLAGAGALLAGLPVAGIFLVGLSVTLMILFRLLNLPVIEAAVICALVLHFLYYTIIIGGDHFEFRVYSHLVLLLFVSALWLLGSAGIGWKPCALELAFWVILSWPIPWTHRWITRDLTTREQTWYLKASVAEAVELGLPSAPGPLLSYLRAFDTMQSWLIEHGVCMRHQEHKVFHLHQTSIYPARARGIAVSGAGYPVFATGTVGVIS